MSSFTSQNKNRNRNQNEQLSWKLKLGIAGGILFLLGFAYAIVMVKNPTLAKSLIHPALIPAIDQEALCLRNGGREWRNGQCLDYEHDPTF